MGAFKLKIEFVDQLIVGSLDGTLAIIDPGRDVENRQEMASIVETQLSSPVLQATHQLLIIYKSITINSLLRKNRANK